MTDSRREFLKTSTTALAAVSALGLSRRAHAGSDDTVRIGLVGCGGRGSGACAQALSTEGKVELVAIGDAFKDQLDGSLNRLKKSAEGDDTKIINCPEDRQFVGFDAFKKVIDSDIDLVILATPPGFRPMMFEYAVEKGKHVFMEKPVASDAPGIRKVMEAAKKAQEKNLKVGVGLQRRHRNSYRELIGKVKDGLIGDLTHMRVYWNSGGVWDPRKSRDEVATEMEYQMRNWYYYTWLCADHITEQHIHNIDVGNWIMSELTDGEVDHPEFALGMGGRQVRTDPKYGEIYDHFACQFTYPNDIVMFSECRHIRNCWNSVEEHLHGTKGVMNLSDGGRNSWQIWGEEKPERWRGKIDDAYQVEHDELFAAVRNDTPYSEADYGAKSTMTAILGRLATYSGKKVTWDEAMTSEKSLIPDELGWEVDPPVLPNEDGVYPVPMPGVTKVL